MALSSLIITILIGLLLAALASLALLSWLYYLARQKNKVQIRIQLNHEHTIFELQQQLKKALRGPNNQY